MKPIITVFTLIFFLNVSHAQSFNNEQPSIDPRRFDTKATFSVDDDAKSLSSVIATIEKHPMHGPEYLWLEVNFYSFPFTTEEIKSAANGDLEPIERRRHEEDYNSQAEIIFSMDKSYKVWQVDMSMPGHSCTIASSEKEVKSFLREYLFEGG